MKAKRGISILLSAILVLGNAAAVLANEGTTTNQTAYKSLAANTEIYG